MIPNYLHITDKPHCICKIKITGNWHNQGVCRCPTTGCKHLMLLWYLQPIRLLKWVESPVIKKKVFNMSPHRYPSGAVSGNSQTMVLEFPNHTSTAKCQIHKTVYLKCPKQWDIILLGGNITEGLNWNNCLLLMIIKTAPLVLTSYLIKVNTLVQGAGIPCSYIDGLQTGWPRFNS